MSARCLAAFTALTGSRPPYINAYEHDDGSVTVTVRGACREGEHDSPSAQITLSPLEWAIFKSEINGGR